MNLKSKRNTIIKRVLPLMIAFSFCACTENKSELTTLCDSYSTDAISYFSEVGFRDHQNMQRWAKDIKILVSESNNPSDLKAIDDFIETFNQYAFGIRMKRVTSEGNLEIKFHDNEKLNPKRLNGLCTTEVPMFSNHITSANILIVPFNSDETKRRVIHRELLKAIGLKPTNQEYDEYNLMGKYTFKSIEDSENKLYDFRVPNLDKQAIRLLYDYKLEAGLKRDVFLKAVNG
ncbi:DUF2927 domain-containing protein [Marinifilum caeruleilacunae]|uniref:DUF2927 domain-containing protein n=1 Tax=Marinifilum caeruleilacunae TaxID=2499076 RepID=A0ABX1WRW5_9BACT|nr:DUF2927 domain-containing protein [Marinifilum caeruleilacunae]NOU58839.1 DUF2927 domain-containing protein [Marinifilum caeruleilacunae]